MRCFFILCCFILSGFGLFAQSEQLARHYFDQGEFEKALAIYEQLEEKKPSNPAFFYGIISSHQQLENFDEAEELLFDKLENTANNPNLLIEIGYNFQLQENEEKARQFYDEALAAVDSRPNYAIAIARGFEKYSLLDEAIKAYEKGMQLNGDQNFNLQLARLYGEQGKIEKMFVNYIDLVDENPDFFAAANREFGKYITDDGSAEANVVLRRLLLQKLQEDPLVLYNRMLSWLFIQQNDFDKAFLQEKALYRRGEGNLNKIIELTILAKQAGEIETAMEIVPYIIEEAPSEDVWLQAQQLLLSLRIETEAPSEYNNIEKRFTQIFDEFGYGTKTLPLQIDYANFLAFQQEKNEEAAKVLKDLSAITNTKYEEAMVKMALADVLVMQEKFNEALIYYSQVQKLVKNDEIAQNARYKVAKTSYYKGDFEWAKTQLDVLKSSTSQLIANDAMELSLLIEDNSIEDTTQAALKLYARADLLAFQEKNEEAIAVLDEILTVHKGEKIEDEALLKQAALYEEEEEFSKAEANYLSIIENYNTDILADNANFYLAQLYAQNLEEPEKAKDFFEQIIFNFADSIYFVEARKEYRLLRGDAIE